MAKSVHTPSAYDVAGVPLTPRTRRLLALEFGDREDFDDPKLEWRRLFSELLGTFFLVLVAAGGGLLHAKGQISLAAAVVAPGHVGFNGRLAALITKGVGNMWAFYAVALAMGLWMVGLGASLFGDAYPRSLMLLVFGGIVQMLLMIAIMVGQQVLGQAADKRAMRTYKDAEASLHECQKIQAHLYSQDKLRETPG